MRLYIAGPMTGIPQFNYPAFEAMARSLRRADYDVVSPAEMDDPATQAAALASHDGAPGTGSANGETWGDFLARDVKLIADDGIEGIVVLPGWANSRGARLETFVGRALCGIRVYTWEPTYEQLRPVSFLALAKGWLGKSDISFHSAHEERQP
jgi:hypothetical protein